MGGGGGGETRGQKSEGGKSSERGARYKGEVQKTGGGGGESEDKKTFHPMPIAFACIGYSNSFTHCIIIESVNGYFGCI